MATARQAFSSVLCLTLLLGFCVASVRDSAAGLGGNITVFADPGATSCSLVDQGSALLTVYVVHSNIQFPTLGSKFRVVESSGFHGTFVSEAILPSSTTYGSFRVGVDMAYGGCFTGSLLLGSITYQGQGTSEPCGYVDVVANPNPPGIFTVPAAQLCIFEWEEAQPLVKLYVNPVEGQCDADCGSTVGVRESTWGSVKSLYR